jgi:hypothetical protein
MSGEALTVQDADDQWGDDPGDRWVMLRTETSCSGLWHADGSLDTVEGPPPIPRTLADRIEAFAGHYKELGSLNTSFPHRFYWEQRADAPLDQFNAEGRGIARALKAALPSDWTVVYENVDAWLHKDAPQSAVQLVLPATPPMPG